MERILIDLLQELTHAFGCSGTEGQVREAVRRKLSPNMTDAALYQDGLGNLLVRTGRHGAPRLMLDAHMDSVGIMLTDVADRERLKFRAIGFLVPRILPGTVMLFERGQRAVIETDADDGVDITLNDLYLRPLESDDIFQVGDVAIYEPNFSASDGFASGTFLDNRAGCAALLMAMEEMRDSPNEVWCCFSVQEEVGMRGAAAAAHCIRPHMAFAIDMGIARPGCGIIEKMMDDSIICASAALRTLENATANSGIPRIRTVGGAGYTNAGGIHTAGGCPTAIIGIPAENLHSPREKICLKDVLACSEVLKTIAKTELEVAYDFIG